MSISLEDSFAVGFGRAGVETLSRLLLGFLTGTDTGSGMLTGLQGLNNGVVGADVLRERCRFLPVDTDFDARD